MTDQELMQRLKSALEATAPDDFGDVLSRCEAGKGTVIDMTNATNNNTNNGKKPWKRALIAACLALVVLAGGGGGIFYQQAHAVASIVSLDVNPSIELTVNKNEKVLTCKGLNAEAAVVLMDMDGGHDLEGAKLDVAVNAIVGALVRNGYLDHLDSAILISVEDKDAARGERIQQELTEAVGGTLQSAANSAAVLTQTVAADKALDAQAQQNNISTGKAYLVEQVMAIDPDLTFEGLAALSVEELRDLITTGVPGMPIGRDAALQAVLDGLGLTKADVSGMEVDPELDDRTPCYEVELLIDGREQEFGVHAYTGEVLRGLDVQTAPGPALPASGDDIGEDAAYAAALAKAGVTESDVTWSKVKRDYDDGRLEYEVEFRTVGMEYDCTVDAATGTIRDWDAERLPGAMTGPGPVVTQATNAPAATNAPTAAQTGDIGEDAAYAAALAKAGVTESDVTRSKVKRDYDDGRLEYEVEFRTADTEYECTVDAATGDVFEFDSERADNDWFDD